MAEDRNSGPTLESVRLRSEADLQVSLACHGLQRSAECLNLAFPAREPRPSEPCGRERDVSNAIFPCGLVHAVTSGEIRLYYGAADTSIWLATAQLAARTDAVGTSEVVD